LFLSTSFIRPAAAVAAVRTMEPMTEHTIKKNKANRMEAPSWDLSFVLTGFFLIALPPLSIFIRH
jgi:hypothetical protein